MKEYKVNAYLFADGRQVGRLPHALVVAGHRARHGRLEGHRLRDGGEGAGQASGV